MVRKSSTVIFALRGSGFCTGCLSGKNGRMGASTPESKPLSMAMPTSMSVTDFVAERVLRRAVASEPSK